MATFGDWIQAARPRTLVAAAVPVAVAGAVCQLHGQIPDFSAGVLLGFCLGFAVFAQVASNFANDLGDGLRGTDQAGRVGPARAVANGRISARAMGWATGICCLLAFVAGTPLALAYDPWLFVAGVLALLLALGYTLGPLPLAYVGLGDIFVVACFGVQATFLTGYVLHLAAMEPLGCSCHPGGSPDVAAAWPSAVKTLLVAGLGIGLLADNILLANNARDMETDAAAGKRTTVVRFGRGFARNLHAFNLVVGLGCLAWVFGPLPLLLAPFALWSHLRFRKASTPSDFIPFLGQAALLLLLAGALCVTSACLRG